jgi:hypothetical protein
MDFTKFPLHPSTIQLAKECKIALDVGKNNVELWRIDLENESKIAWTHEEVDDIIWELREVPQL